MFFHKSVHNFLISIAILAHCTIAKPMSYTFNYAINAGEIVSQQTEEAHNNVITGSYSFLQPDGKIRVVRYKVDGQRGFRACIKYRRVFFHNKGPLKFPRDFQHPIRFVEPISPIPRSLLGPLNFLKKHHK